MTHTKTLLTLAAIILLFTNCNKNIDGGTGATDPANLPKTYTENIQSTYYGNSVTTYNLTYDGDSKLVSLVSASSSGDKIVYKYGSSTGYTMDIYNSNVLNIHENFYLNSSSLVDSTFQYNDTQDSSTEKYIYNAAKQMTKSYEYDYTKAGGAVLVNTHTYTYDSDGNPLSDTDDNSTQQYTWYSDLTNPAYLGQYGFPNSKHLMKTLTLSSGGVTATVNYTYTFDSKNRLVSEKDVASYGDIIIKTYTY